MVRSEYSVRRITCRERTDATNVYYINVQFNTWFIYRGERKSVSDLRGFNRYCGMRT